MCVSFSARYSPKNSHLAFKVVNVCQNELTFKINLRLLFVSGGFVCVCDVRIIVCMALPSFSLHLNCFGGIFEMCRVDICTCIYHSLSVFVHHNNVTVQ